MPTRKKVMIYIMSIPIYFIVC